MKQKRKTVLLKLILAVNNLRIYTNLSIRMSNPEFKLPGLKSTCYYRSQRSCGMVMRQGNVFHTCLWFCSRGGVSVQRGLSRRGVSVQGGLPDRDSPVWQRAGGTYPTGMHSCCEYILIFSWLFDLSIGKIGLRSNLSNKSLLAMDKRTSVKIFTIVDQVHRAAIFASGDFSSFIISRVLNKKALQSKVNRPLANRYSWKGIGVPSKQVWTVWLSHVDTPRGRTDMTENIYVCRW